MWLKQCHLNHPPVITIANWVVGWENQERLDRAKKPETLQMRLGQGTARYEPWPKRRTFRIKTKNFIHNNT